MCLDSFATCSSQPNIVKLSMCMSKSRAILSPAICRIPHTGPFLVSSYRNDEYGAGALKCLFLDIVIFSNRSFMALFSVLNSFSSCLNSRFDRPSVCVTFHFFL